MIVRACRGYAPPMAADAYSRHLLGTVRPNLERLPGFRGLYLLSRRLPNEVEYEVLTMWESMDAIRAFAGEHVERAVVEPEAAAVLTRFDQEVRHYEVMAGPGGKIAPLLGGGSQKLVDGGGGVVFGGRRGVAWRGGGGC